MKQRRLYLGNIPTWTEITGLERIFSAYGDILEVEIAKNRITEEPLGHAYITFFSPEAAERAMRAKNGQVIGGRIVEIHLLDD
jgi:RNA recognition motif-containing protein